MLLTAAAALEHINNADRETVFVDCCYELDVILKECPVYTSEKNVLLNNVIRKMMSKQIQK